MPRKGSPDGDLAQPVGHACASTRPNYVAGIGASAGGLEALRELLAYLPPTGQVAYVIAQHMGAPEQAELLGRLLERGARLPVVLASTGDALQADRIYLLPAGGDFVVQAGRLHGVPPAPESLSRPSVSRLFESMARAYGPRAIGMIVSGTGSDGVAGCRAIREAGGLTIAQEPGTARFPAMPRAAQEAGVVDEVLSPRQMAERLAGFGPLKALSDTPPEPTDQLDRILQRIRQKTGLDFTGYKEETLLRRLNTRLAALKQSSLQAYLHCLDRDSREAEVIAGQFLISRSSFFRDRDCFAALEKLLGQRLAERPAEQPFRVWVPGCATGEECYTLAILAWRILRDTGQGVQILGTDLNAEALEQAREAVYPASSLEETEPELRDSCFTRSGSNFQVLPAVKALCQFRRHDVVHEQAPQDLELISCRNLLIYLKSELQQQLLIRFHGALRREGLLFLGLSETVTVAAGALFRPLDAAHKIYQRRSS